MHIDVNRKWLTQEATVSEISVGGQFLCYGLEDCVREIEGQPVEDWKIPRQTAIPAGTYAVEITPSARFKRDMMQVMDVPGFAGIRIHAGNTSLDTEGCLLVGDSYNPEIPDWIGGSRSALVKIFGTVQSALHRGDDVTITFKQVKD